MKRDFLKFIAIGILFHVIYLYSMIDIYFQSPLIPIEKQYRIPEDNEPVSKRVFFFVFDGATSDDFFPMGAPIIREKYIETGKASWGISHTRVPTESRPCHVAMFGGFYEDPSSVTTGWSVNPVSYDSVIQQSKYSMLVGAADVVELFDNMDHVDVFSFPMEMEDFATGNPSFLDQWVEDKFFEKVEDPEIQKKLKQDQIIVFLQFEGIDAAGHEFRPETEGYRKAIQFVDRSVQKIVDWVEEFYNHDGMTTFVAATDHGMSKIGTHGGAEYGCTRTPFVAWGSGVPLSSQRKDDGVTRILNDGRFKDEESEVEHMVRKWNMDRSLAKNRFDLAQADISPLIASWLGLNVPVNNLGVLPLGYCCSSGLKKKFSSVTGDYVDKLDLSLTLDALIANTEQINEQFRTFEKIKSEQISIHFLPFFQDKNLANQSFNLILSHEEVRLDRQMIEKMIHEENFEELIQMIEKFIEWNLEGIKYYQQYHKFFLLGLISFGYVSYIIYLLLLSVRIKNKGSKTPKSMIIVFVALYSLFGIYLIQQHSSFMTYIYAVFPFYFCLRSAPLILDIFKSNPMDLKTIVTFVIPKMIFHVIFVEMIVFGFFDRHIFALGYFGFGLIRRSGWCFTLGLFSLFPLNLGNQLHLVIIGVLIFLFIWFFFTPSTSIGKKPRRIFSRRSFLVMLVLLAIINVVIVESTVTLVLFSKVMSWVLLSISVLFPILFPNRNDHIFERFEHLVLTFSVSYVLLSVNYEIIFFTNFTIALYEWLVGSHNKNMKGDKNDGIFHVSNNLFFLYFFISSFFATGNLASFSSFQISSVYRFVTTLRPFLMASLLVWKLSIPFVITIITMNLIRRGTNQKSGSGDSDDLLMKSLYNIVAFCDIMSLTFLFLVKDVGSWLEIGNSISRFAYSNLMLIIMLIMYFVGLLYIRNLKNKKK